MNDQDHDEVLYACIQDPREAAYYLNAALEDSDEMFKEALRDVASAYKISNLAKRAGVTRQAVYKMLTKRGNPTFASLMAILRALNLRIAFEPDIISPSPPSAEKSPTVNPVSQETTSTRAAMNLDDILGRQVDVLLWYDRALSTRFGGRSKVASRGPRLQPEPSILRDFQVGLLNHTTGREVDARSEW